MSLPMSKITALLNTDGSKRCSAEEALQLEWLKTAQKVRAHVGAKLYHKYTSMCSFQCFHDVFNGDQAL